MDHSSTCRAVRPLAARDFAFLKESILANNYPETAIEVTQRNLPFRSLSPEHSVQAIFQFCRPCVSKHLLAPNGEFAPKLPCLDELKSTLGCDFICDPLKVDHALQGW
jgi:hypothetical protein